MFGIAVRFDVLPGQEEVFDRMIGEALAGVRDLEPGTLVYACHTVEGEPGARLFYELYRDRAAWEEHERQGHMRPFLDGVGDLVARPPRVDLLELTAAKGLDRLRAEGDAARP